MSTADLHVIVDPNFPQYLYAAEPLAAAYTTRTGGKKGASLLLGEWMKIIEPDAQLPATGRIHVAYRGGQGYVNPQSASRRRCLEVFFIDVDQGDSILIQTPDDRRVLIDGGESADALEFIRNKYRLDKKDHYVDFEAVVATHSDADHTQGLLRILKHPRIAVKRVYHNGLFRRTDAAKDPGRREDGRVFGLVHAPSANAVPKMKTLMKSFVEAVATARANLPGILDKMRQLPRWKGRVEPPPGGFQFRRLDAADKYLPPYDRQNEHLAIEVLGPRASGKGAKASYPWYGDAGKTVNGNSIVLRLVHGDQTILLTGDLNEPSMDDLLADLKKHAKNAHSRVYKAAHHGSQHFSVDFLRAVKPDAAVISSGDNRNDAHGHPRAVLLGTITRYSQSRTPAVFSTELAACFRKLSKKEQAAFKKGTAQLHERSIQGIVHLRSDGERLVLGTVHGRRAEGDQLANTRWKWDIWPDH